MKKEATYAVPMRARSTFYTKIRNVEPGARPIVWNIAGADLQADLQALQAFGVHGCTAVAATCVEPVSAALLDAQLAALAQDMPPHAIKVGLLGRVENVRVVCHWVDHVREAAGAQGWEVPLVVDSALGANTDAAFADDAVLQAYADELLPRATLIAPYHHGTGCTFAATAAAALASGYCEADAVVLAKMATTQMDFAQHIDNLQPFAPLSNPALGVYAVVDSAAWVRRVLAAGIRTVQLRIKDPAEPTLAAQIQEAIAVARETPGAQLFINDHWQLALAHGAYGVHLGQEDLELVDLAALRHAGVRLGLSTHSYWEVARAWALRPSYIACGPIFATQSKDMPWIPQGLDNLRYWASVLPLPVVGIAGIGVHNVAEVAATGAASAAVISAITQAADPAQACRELMAGFARGKALSL